MTVQQFIEWYCLCLAQMMPYAVVMAIISRLIKWVVNMVTGKEISL